MRKFAYVVAALLLTAVTVTASAAPTGPAANLVFGQANFTSNGYNHGGLGAASLGYPQGLAADSHGRLFVAERYDNRVVEYDPPFSNGMAASRVFGQPDFSSNDANHGGLSASSLDQPAGLAVDSHDNLYVVDFNNNRVLEYDAPTSTDSVADRVFGQPGFTSADINQGGLGNASLNSPFDVAVDGVGNVYVADRFNCRVLEYNVPLTSDQKADRVFGQTNFTSASCAAGAGGLNEPVAVRIDQQGNLFVADGGNNRVLKYNVPLTGDHLADLVLGQPDFTTTDANHGGLSASSLSFPSGLAFNSSGSLFVADSNNRVVRYAAPFHNDMAASAVYGQPDFVSMAINNGGVSAGSLNGPSGVTLDIHDNLFISDFNNHRVLEFNAPRRLFLPLVMR